jgi:hypothetical protein
MNKIPVFISFSANDDDKKKIAQETLDRSNHFTAVVITREIEPMISLSEKVKKGILKSKYFVPILTPYSINTQWINQEIGFAIAHEKEIIPIIDAFILNDLKGFINRELDLPFSFQINSNKSVENKSFSSTVKKLLIKLIELEGLHEREPIKEKKVVSVIDPLDIVTSKQKFLEKRKLFLKSGEANQTAKVVLEKIIISFKEFYRDLSERKLVRFLSRGSSGDFRMATDQLMLKIKMIESAGGIESSILQFLLTQKTEPLDRFDALIQKQRTNEYDQSITSSDYYFSINEKNENGWCSAKDRRTDSFLTTEQLIGLWKKIFTNHLSDQYQKL